MSKKLKWLLNNLPEVIAGPCMVVMTTLTTLNAFSRYAFGYTFPGLDDIIALLFCWCLFLGAAVACKRGKHFGIDLIIKKLPEGFGKYVELLVMVVQVVATGILVYLAWQLTLKVGDRKLTSLNIPYVYLDLGFLLGMVLIFVYTAIDFVKMFKKPQNHKSGTESE